MNPMSTAAHAAVTALVGVAQAAAPGVQVIDGPPAVSPEKDTIVVGLGEPSVITQRGEPDFGGRCTETGEIVCVISCWTGDTDFTAVRARVVELLGLLDAALRTDPTMGDAVDEAGIGETGEMSQVLSKGAVCALGFTVSYTAHI